MPRRKAKARVRKPVKYVDGRFELKLAKATRQAMELSMIEAALAKHEARLDARPEHLDAKERERLFRSLRGKLRVIQQLLDRQATA